MCYARESSIQTINNNEEEVKVGINKAKKIDIIEQKGLKKQQ